MNRIAKSSAALAAGIFIALAAPLAASAHVIVDPNQAEAGSYSRVVVQVPNESASATTTTVDLTLPADTPFGYVGYVPVAGWTTTLVKKGDTVSHVIWTADAGSEIADGQVQLFPLVLGPIPDVGSVILATDQTYSDGTVVSWSETEEGAEHPAPVLYINDAPVAHEHDDADEGGTGDDNATVEVDNTHVPVAATTDVLARVLGIGGLVVGVIGLVFGITGRRSAAK